MTTDNRLIVPSNLNFRPGKCIAGNKFTGKFVIGFEDEIKIIKSKEHLKVASTIFTLPDHNSAHSLKFSEQMNHILFAGNSIGDLYTLDLREPACGHYTEVFKRNPLTEICPLKDGVSLVVGSSGSSI